MYTAELSEIALVYEVLSYRLLLRFKRKFTCASEI